MVDQQQPIKLAVACKQFFGLKTGQAIGEFAAEIRELTPQDREELASMLTKELGKPVLA